MKNFFYYIMKLKWKCSGVWYVCPKHLCPRHVCPRTVAQNMFAQKNVCPKVPLPKGTVAQNTFAQKHVCPKHLCPKTCLPKSGTVAQKLRIKKYNYQLMEKCRNFEKSIFQRYLTLI